MKRGGRGVILLYHRIAEPDSDPFELAVSRRRFLEHLDVLQSLGSIEPVDEVVRRVRARGRARPPFALTFDDGYQDNLAAALPILEERGASATMFVTTAFVGEQAFWWDELAELLLRGASLPSRIELDLDDFGRGWEATAMPPRRLFDEVWAVLQGLDDGSRRRALAGLRSDLTARPSTHGRPLTLPELTQLARSSLVSIGAHTQTHPVLARVSESSARAEVIGSKAWLEDVLDRPVTAFSYPYGGSDHYGPGAVEAVRAAGFELACSGMPGTVARRSDVLQLPRLAIGDWEGDVLERELTTLVRGRL